MESFFVKLFLHALLHCCKRPVIRRMAMLGPPVHDGLYPMAWTVLAGWRCSLDFAGVLADWNRPLVVVWQLSWASRESGENFWNIIIIIIIIIIQGSKSREGDITPNIFLAHTPAGAESDLTAAAAAPSQTEVTDLNCSDHSTTSKEMARGELW